MLTPEELRQIRRLHLQAGRRVDSPFSGDYRSAFRGQGMEFEEVRPYIPGDDVRHIDWNVTARTGEAFVKQFKEERELTLVLAVDVSGSVSFGSGGRDGRTDKRLQIARLAGALAFAAIRTGDRVGLLRFSDRIEQFVPPSRKRGHAWGCIQAAFEQPAEHRKTDLAGALQYLGSVVRRRAVLCILSDFLAPGEWTRDLSILARRHRVNAFVVTDPIEERLPPVGLVELQDAETGRRRLVDSRALRPRRSLDERLMDLRRVGVRARSVPTTADPFFELLRHFRGLEGMR